ncbi:MAG TPA: glycosyltransferase family 61 protein [Ideonella sp.]|uniref:glycosyltransferase family 61 protein n=1 Tax=Ideonella sp. TaxID=1929293 RepID=UPI002B7B6BC2|nr:glycosyltransferase family 61 protein [Ideonella sp.]HSI50743.1 glycosyltransferase family 61 protein [Ideonella sp.]
MSNLAKPQPRRSSDVGSAVRLHGGNDANLIRRQPPASAAPHYIFNRPNLYIKESAVWEIADATLTVDGTVPGHPQFYVFDAAGKLIEGFSSGGRPFIAEDLIPLRGTVGLLDDRFSVFNTCHLLLDKLTRIPRLAPAEVDRYFLVLESTFASFLFDCLGLAVCFGIVGPRKQKLSYKVERLLVTDAAFFNMSHPGQGLDVISAAFIEDRLRPAVASWLAASPEASALPDLGKRLYVSRQAGKARRIANESEAHEVIAQHGFQAVQFEEMSVPAQLHCSLNADAMLGLHGAGLTNGAFMPRGSRLLELLPPLCATAAYWTMGLGLGYRYDAMICEAVDGQGVPDYSTWVHDVKFNRDDVKVPPQALDAFLTRNL